MDPRSKGLLSEEWQRVLGTCFKTITGSFLEERGEQLQTLKICMAPVSSPEWLEQPYSTTARLRRILATPKEPPVNGHGRLCSPKATTAILPASRVLL